MDKLLGVAGVGGLGVTQHAGHVTCSQASELKLEDRLVYPRAGCPRLCLCPYEKAVGTSTRHLPFLFTSLEEGKEPLLQFMMLPRRYCLDPKDL